MAQDIISQKIKSAIDLASMTYQSISSKANIDLDSIEAHVQELSREISSLDLAAQDNVKGDLKTLDTVLEKLGSPLGHLQNELSRKMSELNAHKRAFNAYARVVNNNATT